MATNFLHKDLRSITTSSLIAGVGQGLIGIFIPLLLLHRGLQLWQVCGFYALYAFCKIWINFPSIRLVNKYGARFGLITAYSAMALCMLLLTLYIYDGAIWQVLLLALLTALQNSFLWNSQHLHISRVMDLSRKSRDLATMTNLKQAAGIFAPLLGAWIAVQFGAVWLAGFSALIIVLAIIPVWHLDKIGDGHVAVPNLRFDIRHAPLRDVIANFGFNIHSAVGTLVWPIYLAVFIPNFTHIGAVSAVSTAVAVITLHLSARRSDKGKNHTVMMEGIAGSSLVHLARILASSNPLTITFISSLYTIMLDYLCNPWTSLYYAHTKEKGISYITSMEIAGDLAYVSLWLILGIVAYFSHSTFFFTLAFGAAAVAVWLCSLMTKEKIKPV